MKENTLSTLLDSFPDNPWDWYALSQNLNITFEDVQKHPDNSTDYQDASAHPQK